MSHSLYESLGIDTIPNFLRSRTANGLRRQMSRNNLRLRAYVEYKVMWVQSEGVWYAWYNENQIHRDAAGDQLDQPERPAPTSEG